MSHKRKLSKKARRRKRRRILLGVEIIVLILLLGGLFAWFKLGKISFEEIGEIATNELDEDTKEVLQGYTTFAIFGVDNRKVGNYKTGNSDSIMVCSINNDTKEVRIMSVYRDSFLDIGGGSLQKCNAAYAKGGVERAIEMLNKNLDLDIQEYVAVDFGAVVDAVDAVGGVEIEVLPEEVEHLNSYLNEVCQVTGKTSSNVSAGLQTLDGPQAMSYCRIRYTAGDDFRRAERQRTVISKLIEKAKQASVFQLNDLVDAIFPEVSTSLSASETLNLAKNMRDYELVATGGWPLDMRTADLGKKGSVVVPCTLESNVRKAYEFLYLDPTHVASDAVKKTSENIVGTTGFTEQNAVDYLTWQE